MTVAINSSKVRKVSYIELMKKMNRIVQALQNCDQRFIIHEFVNETPEEDMGNYVEFIFEPRTEMTGPKIIGAKVSKYN